VYLATDITDLASYQCDAVVKQRDSNVITLSNAVDYRSDKTSKITSISPALGTTAGNTAITITGENFFEDSANTKVTIDGIDCPIDDVTTTQITCTTGARPVFTPSTFVVDLENGGHAAT
jgi:hypothetical protein